MKQHELVCFDGKTVIAPFLKDWERVGFDDFIEDGMIWLYSPSNTIEKSTGPLEEGYGVVRIKKYIYMDPQTHAGASNWPRWILYRKKGTTSTRRRIPMNEICSHPAPLP